MKKLLLLFLLAGIIAVAGFFAFSFFFSGESGKGYAKLNAIEEKYGLSDENLAPAQMRELNALKAELEELRAEAGSNELRLLAETRLELAEMQENILKAKAETEKANSASIACLPNGAIEKAKNFFDNALANSKLALQKRRAFVNNYPAKAEEFRIGYETLEESVTGLEASIELVLLQLEEAC